MYIYIYIISLSLSLYIYIYTKVSGCWEGLVHGNLQLLQSFTGFRAFQCSGRSDLLKIAQRAPRAAQNRSERAQGRSEPPRAFAQSCSRNRSGSPRAAQNRQERSLKVAQRPLEALRARPELLRAAQSCSRKRSGSQGYPERAQSCSV